jgi:hypothetical protein
MAEIPKVLYDDHQRLERMFARYNHSRRAELVVGILDELEIALTTAEEFALPLVRGANASLAQVMDAEQQKIRDLMADVSELEPDDPEVPRAMKRLERAVLVHINHTERDVIPTLKRAVQRGDLYEAGRNAFTLRQEMLGQLEFRPRLQPLGIPGNGWGSGRPIADAQW